MRKFLSLILALVMSLSLVACGSDPVETPADGVISNVETVEPETSDEPAAADIININESIVVVDNEFVTFTVKSVFYDEFWESYGLKVFLENKTDKTVMFSWDEVSVNGYMCDPFWGTEVVGGKKENTEICWYLTSLEENDIDYTQITDIEFKLSATHYDEDWNATTYVEDVFKLNFN